MSDDNNKVVIVRHHIVTEEVRPLPSLPKKDVPNEKESDKWCCTRIQEARKRNANDTKKCWSEVIQIILESCDVLVLFVFENLIGIVFLILGIVFLKDCPIRPAIPISLIVYGIFSIIHGITVQLIRWKYVDMSKKNDGFATCAHIIILITSIAHFVALFLACYLVFNIYGEVKTGKEHKSSDTYCHPFLYWFSFWFFVFMAIIGFILIVLLCCLCCFILSGAVQESPQNHIIVVHQAKSDSQPNQNPEANANNQPVIAQQQSVGNQSSTVPPPTAQ